VSEKLNANQRRTYALANFNRLMADYRALLDKPGEQLHFLMDLQARRDKQKLQVDNLFAQIQDYNAQTDVVLTEGAKYFNNVQAVATIALCVMAPAAGAANAGRVFVYVLATKSIIAVAQSEHSWDSLMGFVIGTLKNGVVTLGELSNKVFELTKDAMIEESRNRMGRATAQYLTEMSETTARIARLQAEMWKSQAALMLEKKGSSGATYLQNLIRSQNAEIQAAKAQMARYGTQAVEASRTGQFMKNFGGKAVPVVCVAIDAVLEYQRWWETNDAIEAGAAGSHHAAGHH
jgi:hypothetical protein